MIAYKGFVRDGADARTDSIIDDLSFRLAYKLSYDANGGDKTDTSQIKASSDGTVKSIADKTSKVPVHDLEDTDVPGQYRDFILDTTKVKFSDVKFENGAWLNAPMPDSGDGATAMFPLKIGASATLPNVGEWTDGSGHTHSINAVISLHSWNGGSISRLWTRLDGQPSTSRDLFWINTVGRNSDLPAQVIKALGGIDTSKRVGCQWTVNFTYEDGTPVPDTFRGVTGFNDLDGWDVQPDLKFEGVQLVSGFDGAYKTRDAELATYGINGFAGVKHDSGPESNLDSKQQVKHRLAATWTGSSFTFGYDLQNPEGRDSGCRMTFGVPVTRTKVLTYDANGGKGSVPSHTEAGKVEAASAKTAGSVHAISDATDTTGSAEGKAVSGVLTDTTVDAGDGTKQRTIRRFRARGDHRHDGRRIRLPGLLSGRHQDHIGDREGRLRLLGFQPDRQDQPHVLRLEREHGRQRQGRARRRHHGPEHAERERQDGDRHARQSEDRIRVVGHQPHPVVQRERARRIQRARHARQPDRALQHGRIRYERLDDG